jgi:hypothetical protein
MRHALLIHAHVLDVKTSLRMNFFELRLSLRKEENLIYEEN